MTQVKQMFVIWIAAMAVTLMVITGIISLVFYSQRVQFGLQFDLAYIRDIEVWGGEGRNLVQIDDERRPYKQLRQEVLFLINDAHRTNRLFQFFQDGGTEQFNFNTTMQRNTDNIQTLTNRHYIKINFWRPQFGVLGTNSTNFRVVRMADYPTANGIRQIFIPLGDVPNSFRQVTWFINMVNEPNDNIGHMFTTFANYYRLANATRGVYLL